MEGGGNVAELMQMEPILYDSCLSPYADKWNGSFTLKEPTDNDSKEVVPAEPLPTQELDDVPDPAEWQKEDFRDREKLSALFKHIYVNNDRFLLETVKDRAKELFCLLLKAEALLGAAALLIVELFPHQLIGIFGAANESVWYTTFAVRSFRIYLCMMIFATINKGTFIYLQAIGKAFASTMISMIREVIFGVGFALLLPRLFGLNGVLYSMPVSDILTFLIAAVVIRNTMKELSVRNDAIAVF